MTNNRARVRWTWLVAVVCVLAALLLVFDTGGLRALLFPSARTEAAPSDASLLGAAGPHEATGPTLEGAPRSDKTEGGAQPAGHGPVTVTVADRAGRGIGGVRVELRATGSGETLVVPAASEQVTDEAGRAVFGEDGPYNGSRWITATARGGPVRLDGAAFLIRLQTLADGRIAYVPAKPDADTSTGQALGGGPVLGPDLRVTIARALPLEVDVREAPEGRSVRAHWQATPRLEWAEETADHATIPVDADGGAQVSLSVTAPRGDVAPPRTTWSVWVHPASRRLAAVMPVRAEAEITALCPREILPFHDEDWNLDVSIGGELVPRATAHVGSEGRVRIRGVPHLPGEKVTLGGTIAERWVVSGETVLTDDPLAPLEVEMTAMPLPPAGLGTLSLEPGSFTFTLDNQGLVILTQSLRASLVAPSPPDASTGTLRVRVRLPSGAPAAGALVETDSPNGAGVTAITDLEGRAVLPGVAQGTHAVRVNGAGATTTAPATVEAGHTTEVEVSTAEGGTIEVAVVDSRGHPLPYATLTITQPSGLPWLDLEGELQRIDPYTDELGHRTLRRVESDLVKVKATFGSRSAEATVTVVEGRTSELRLVLRPPEPPPTAAAEPVVEPVAAER